MKYRVQTFLFGYSRQVERLEVCQCDMTRVSFVTLLYEVHHILVSGREGQVLGKDRLDVLGGDDLAVTLVEEMCLADPGLQDQLTACQARAWK